MEQQPVLLQRNGAIAEIILNRPEKLNALNHEVWRALTRFSREVAQDDAIKVVIFRGVGERAFAAGADISEFSVVHATGASARAYHADIAATYAAIEAIGKPTIAMIRGICFGGGCAVALCCDLRYADETARFCIPPARLGIAYSLGETKRLADQVGPSRAKEMLMGAKEIGAAEALQNGLITRLFAAEELAAGTLGFAEELCGLSQYSVRAAKTMVNLIVNGQTEDDEVTRGLEAGAFEGPDYQEGRNAFLQKRKAKFS